MTIKIKVKKIDGPPFDKSQVFVLKNVNSQNDNYSGKKIHSFVVVKSHFSQCQFKNLSVEDMCFGCSGEISSVEDFKIEHTSIYEDCNFDGSRLDGIWAGHAKFIRCSFRNVYIRDLNFGDCQFIDCVFSGKLHRINFFGKPRMSRRKFNEFRGNDFSEVEFFDTGFRGGIDLTKQKFPQSDRYIYAYNGIDFINKLKAALSQIQNEKLKKQVNTVIKVCEYFLKEGQKQLFLIADELTDDIALQKEVISIVRNAAN